MTHMQVDPIVREFLEISYEIGPASGLDQLSSSIIGILFLEPEEITMEDLVEKTGYSKASISQKLKTLVPMGLIRRRTRPGSRKVYLYMEKNLFALWKEHMKRHYIPEIKIVKDKIPGLIEKYRNQELTGEQLKRIQIIENYYSQILKFETMIHDLYEEIDKLKV